MVGVVVEQVFKQRGEQVQRLEYGKDDGLSRKLSCVARV